MLVSGLNRKPRDPLQIEAALVALDLTDGQVLVSHDMHLLSLVADRLWLVKDGNVAPYEGDLESYRAMLLSSDKPAKAAKTTENAKPAKVKKPSRDAILVLKKDAKKCEQRIEKLSEMKTRVAEKLADPAIYDDIHGLKEWQKKFAEIEQALTLAETLWMESLERLEAAES